jgi:hypothetical protein
MVGKNSTGERTSAITGATWTTKNSGGAGLWALS